MKIIVEEGKKYKKMDFNYFWETRANKEEKTTEKLKEMQEYCKQVEPIYNNYWNQKRNETNKKDLSQVVNKEKTEKVTVKREPSSKFKQLVK